MTIHYVAWLQERLNCAEQEVSPPSTVNTVASLLAWLATLSDGAALAFENPDLVRVAVGSRLANLDTPIVDGDVVTLFPPMIGG